jgi:uncharacterized membrane protein YqgA involved in biofilm formation
MFPGFGTVVNVATVVAGSGIGLLLGHRLPQRTRDTVTDGLGLVTLLIAALSAVAVTDPALSAAVGDDAPVLIVLGAVLVGGIVGSLLQVESRLEGAGGWLRDRLTSSRPGDVSQHRFVEGFVTASLVFCVGPLTILGSLSDGLGEGSQQLLLKAALDGFASVAFAASLGVGVMASAVSVLVVQGTLTLLGALLGSFVPEPHLLALTATGGVLLAGVGLRLLQVKAVAVGDLLPALLVAPLLTALVMTVG